MTEIRFETLSQDNLDQALPDLTEILHACVSNGASVSFIAPFTIDEARAFWLDKVYPVIRDGNALLLVARDEDKIIGTVQLHLSMPPNQAHRCEVAKLLVHPSYRKRGIATTLMEVLESEARVRRKSLITLDTRSGDQAEPLYILLDYKIAGRIPNFARATDSDRLDSTTYMYKILS